MRHATLCCVCLKRTRFACKSRRISNLRNGPHVYKSMRPMSIKRRPLWQELFASAMLFA